MKSVLGKIAMYVRKNAVEGCNAPSVRFAYEAVVPMTLRTMSEKSEQKKAK